MLNHIPSAVMPRFMRASGIPEASGLSTIASGIPDRPVRPGDDIEQVSWSEQCGDKVSRIHMNEIAQQRIDFVIPLPAAEHAIMPDAGLHVVNAAIGTHAGAEVLRGERLADR